jgi:hypothetical protein
MSIGSTHRFAWSWQGQEVHVGYDVRGAGETVVLLPAFSTVATREEMGRLAQHLSVAFRTIVPDWPGFGRGAQVRLDHSPRLHLAFLRAFCEQVAGRQKWWPRVMPPAMPWVWRTPGAGSRSLRPPGAARCRR